MGPETDSLDQRARACYLPCGLLYNEHCYAYQHAFTLSSPLHIIEMCFALSQLRPISFLNKNRCILLTN